MAENRKIYLQKDSEAASSLPPVGQPSTSRGGCLGDIQLTPEIFLIERAWEGVAAGRRNEEGQHPEMHQRITISSTLPKRNK